MKYRTNILSTLVYQTVDQVSTIQLSIKQHDKNTIHSNKIQLKTLSYFFLLFRISSYSFVSIRILSCTPSYSFEGLLFRAPYSFVFFVLFRIPSYSIVLLVFLRTPSYFLELLRTPLNSFVLHRTPSYTNQCLFTSVERIGNQIVFLK